MRAIRRLTLLSLVLAVGGLTAGSAVADECSPALLTNIACRLGFIGKMKTPAPDNAGPGRDVDHGATQGMNNPPPGGAPAVGAYWATQQSSTPADGNALAPPGAPPVVAYPGAYPAPPPAPVAAPAAPDVTHFCTTPSGRYGPYPNVVAVGSPCWVSTPNGVVYGVGG